ERTSRQATPRVYQSPVAHAYSCLPAGRWACILIAGCCRMLQGKEYAVPSPFPGMDPYLEGYLWPDVHSALANTIRQLLAPQIQPKYVARLEISVIEDQNPAAEIGIMYPDVEGIKARAGSPAAPEAPRGTVSAAAVAPLQAPITIPLPQVRVATVA